jgi:FMN phosphatase YigB (HAD superfamily)
MNAPNTDDIKYLHRKMLLIFDFDYTLWDWEKHAFYKDVLDILKKLKEKGYRLSIASYNRSTEFLLKSFKLDCIFESIICNGDFLERCDCKKSFLERVLNESHTAPENAVFFDDMKEFIDTATKMKIKSVLVTNGIKWEDVEFLLV